MTKKKINIAELRAELEEWTRLILENAEIQSQVESDKTPPTNPKPFVTDRAAYETNIRIARRIIEALETKISTWGKTIDRLLKEDAAR